MNTTSLTVFVLFFGLALVEAVRDHRWLEVCAYMTLALLFLWSANRRPTNGPAS